MNKSLINHNNQELIREIIERLTNEIIEPKELTSLFIILGQFIQDDPKFLKEITEDVKKFKKTN